MKYYIQSEHEKYEVGIEPFAKDFTVQLNDGERQTASLSRIDSNRYLMLLDHESFIVNVRRDEDRMTVIIRGKQFEFDVYDEKTHIWKSILEESGGASGDTQISAPMPGLIMSIHVSAGDLIEAGDPVFVLSAMKMENEIKATVSGTVRRVLAAENQAVEKGHVIIELE